MRYDLSELLMNTDNEVVLSMPKVQVSFEEQQWLTILSQRNVSKGYGNGASLSLSDVRASGAPPSGGAPRDGYRPSSSVRPSDEHPSPTPTPSPAPLADADTRARLTVEAVARLVHRVEWCASPRPAQQLPPGVQLSTGKW